MDIALRRAFELEEFLSKVSLCIGPFLGVLRDYGVPPFDDGSLGVYAHQGRVRDLLSK